jgi:hypothetical protein
MKVELNKKDWEEAVKSTTSLLKNAMAQVEVYQVQLDHAEKRLNSFPKEEVKK